MNSKPRETCPNCNEQYVVQAETYSVYNDPKTGSPIKEPPTLMWFCLNPTCKHRWRREPSN